MQTIPVFQECITSHGGIFLSIDMKKNDKTEVSRCQKIWTIVSLSFLKKQISIVVKYLELA